MICGSRLFALHEWVWLLFMIDFQPFLPLASSSKSFLSSKSLILYFLGRSLAKLPMPLNFQHFSEQDLLSFFLDDQTTNLVCTHIP